MSRPSPRIKVLLPVAIAIILLALGGYSLWWYQLARSVEAGIDRWIAERTAAGWAVSTGGVSRSGFPFTLHLVLDRPAVADPAGNGWQGPPLAVDISPLAPGRPHLVAPGQHVLSLSGHPLTVVAKQASADLSLNDGGLAAAAVDLADIAGEGATIGRISASLQRVASGRADHQTASWAVTASLDGLVLPEDPRLLLGHSLTTASLQARLMGELPTGTLQSALKAWRDDGGTLEVDALSFDWPPLQLTGKGTVALDRDMQPILASTSTVRGVFEAVDSLTVAGVIRQKDAGVAKLVLGLLMKPAADGRKELTVPLTVQNRTLSVGPVALLKVPEVVW